MKNDGAVPKNKSRLILLHSSNLLLTLAPSVDDAGVQLMLSKMHRSVNQESLYPWDLFLPVEKNFTHFSPIFSSSTL
jgi:hypothetical protein